MDDFFDYFNNDDLRDSINITQKDIMDYTTFKPNSYLVLRELFFSKIDYIGIEEAYGEIDGIEDYYEEVIKPTISDIIFEDYDEESILSKKMISILLDENFATDLCALVKNGNDYKVYKKQEYVSKAIEDITNECEVLYFKRS
ncbi:hypothetical protein CPT_MarsHill_260 [Staphylococcus phage MarsHill]|nr:hypothetical protein CPT_MarsHill_260 [Staphylococcus phage MarsHill]